ncbi:MAG: hypothetical protein JRK53_08660 [Deltaproteobacteria bacterium]|nr:hypothetical protein [Deltaproteobacteria bacterium]MBW1820016.1 hypothetical protein [Deltaproteobacteria bacterium]
MTWINRTFKLALLPLLLAFAITAVAPGLRTEARAGGGAAFLGGMVAGHIVGGFVRRDRVKTAAAVETASQPKTQTVYVEQQPARSAKPSVEQRLGELDKLARDGYITPEEYKARKKAILDSL